MILTSIESILQQGADDEVRLNIEVLLMFVLHQPRSYLFAHPEQVLTTEQKTHFDSLFKRYQQGEPVAYLVGSREFWSLDLMVTQDTLIPRPETECLVTEILTTFPEDRAVVIADLGTGSGAIAIALASERPQWQIHATDESESALDVARKNAHKHHAEHITFHQGHWCQALPENILFDAIVSNPPYISEEEWPHFAGGLQFEPKTALTSGADGLDAVRDIVATSKAHLKRHGALLIEHGYQQSKQVTAIFIEQNFQHVHQILDLSGHQRATIGYC